VELKNASINYIGCCLRHIVFLKFCFGFGWSVNININYIIFICCMLIIQYSFSHVAKVSLYIKQNGGILVFWTFNLIIILVYLFGLIGRRFRMLFNTFDELVVLQEDGDKMIDLTPYQLMEHEHHICSSQFWSYHLSTLSFFGLPFFLLWLDLMEEMTCLQVGVVFSGCSYYLFACFISWWKLSWN